MFDEFRRADENGLAVDQVIEQIVRIHERLHHDWHDGGWAPQDAANLLKSSRLDWLVSLAYTLKLWKDRNAADKNHDGALILAWANLGSLVEGAMKFFLS